MNDTEATSRNKTGRLACCLQDRTRHINARMVEPLDVVTSEACVADLVLHSPRATFRRRCRRRFYVTRSS